MENEFGKEPKAESISRLPKYRFVAQVTDGGVVSAPFLVRGVRVEEALGEEGQADRLDFLRRESSKATARATPADAIGHLESLDDRILAALRQAGPTRDRVRLCRSLPVRHQDRGGAVSSAGSGAASPEVTVAVVASVVQHRALSTEQVRRLHFPTAGARWVQVVMGRIGRAGCSPHRVRRSPRRLWFATDSGVELATADGALAEKPRLFTADGDQRASTGAYPSPSTRRRSAFLGAARERGDDFGPLSWRHEVLHPIAAHGSAPVAAASSPTRCSPICGGPHRARSSSSSASSSWTGRRRSIEGDGGRSWRPTPASPPSTGSRAAAGGRSTRACRR